MTNGSRMSEPRALKWSRPRGKWFVIPSASEGSHRRSLITQATSDARPALMRSVIVFAIRDDTLWKHDQEHTLIRPSCRAQQRQVINSSSLVLGSVVRTDDRMLLHDPLVGTLTSLPHSLSELNPQPNALNISRSCGARFIPAALIR
jgi:hypothetical protein